MQHFREIPGPVFDHIAADNHELGSVEIAPTLEISRGDNLILTKHEGEGAIGVMVEAVAHANNFVVFRRSLEPS